MQAHVTYTIPPPYLYMRYMWYVACLARTGRTTCNYRCKSPGVVYTEPKPNHYPDCNSNPKPWCGLYRAYPIWLICSTYGWSCNGKWRFCRGDNPTLPVIPKAEGLIMMQFPTPSSERSPNRTVQALVIRWHHEGRQQAHAIQQLNLRHKQIRIRVKYTNKFTNRIC